MTREELDAACSEVGNKLVELYAKLCERHPPAIVMAGMTGGLAACAVVAGSNRESVVSALHSAFDDIEG